MGSYNFRAIEKKWQEWWKENRTFVAEKQSEKPKYYVLDMFPYPSGAGLHVGHPLGYIATDILARYKRLKGFNVLHPMGFDSFGLPAEQYAIKTGIHPAVTTQTNIKRYKEQMEILGFHYDPDAELSTADPKFYKWTQWIFKKLFGHWYDNEKQQARPIAELISIFEKAGNAAVNASTSQEEAFSDAQWKAFDAKQKSDILMNYRLAYADYAVVNWCEALGTVLANEEVKDGKSERGGHPVERRQMKQWMLRITAYADRLLNSLDSLEWSDALKAMQTNWIGKSKGASIIYDVEGVADKLEVFTTRPDTIFGNTFMVVAPEHEIVAKITTQDKKEEVEKYVDWAQNRSERERMADTTKTGVWTGGYAIHPFNGNKLPIYISDYVIITYGTGAIMAVPAHDERDYEFAKKFGIDIVQVIEGDGIEEAAIITKESNMMNSDFLNGLAVPDAIGRIIEELEKKNIGKGKVTFRIRDIIWSRQRYWGEPTPIYYQDGAAFAVPDEELPLTLPEIDEYKPSPDGRPPLARAKGWENRPEGGTRDLNTMPGWAGSSWYFLRYPDAQNEEAFLDKAVGKYWLPVDLYVGGTEHAVGHLLYSRLWTKFLYDIGEVSVDEPFKKLVNQGMIQGVSQLMYRHKERNEFVSADLIEKGTEDQYSAIHANISFVKDGMLDVEAQKKWARDEDSTFILNKNNEFHTTSQVEKMSKSLYNTVDPALVCEEYGADTLRLYEMFLGPLEVAKPWNTQGISGVFNFLKRAWNLFTNDDNELNLSDDKPSKAEYKALHTAIKQVGDSIDRMAFNTAVPAFMVLTKELQQMKCNKREILQDFLLILSPFAPHFCEELWSKLGHESSILEAGFPKLKEEYLAEDSITYPIQINGKVRGKISVPADADKKAVEEAALADEGVQKWMEGQAPRKVIVVPGRIVNIVK
ncbi:MAG: leucine--tRNA ligase [Bacteroidia bacterium]|nr:leucine--tRNA ligase [Bacteroidia bacterium]